MWVQKAWETIIVLQKSRLGQFVVEKFISLFFPHLSKTCALQGVQICSFSIRLLTLACHKKSLYGQKLQKFDLGAFFYQKKRLQSVLQSEPQLLRFCEPLKT